MFLSSSFFDSHSVIHKPKKFYAYDHDFMTIGPINFHNVTYESRGRISLDMVSGTITGNKYSRSFSGQSFYIDIEVNFNNTSRVKNIDRRGHNIYDFKYRSVRKVDNYE